MAVIGVDIIFNTAPPLIIHTYSCTYLTILYVMMLISTYLFVTM